MSEPAGGIPDPTPLIDNPTDGGAFWDDWRVALVLLGVALLVLLWLVRKLRRAIRRGRPARINPNLQKYAEADSDWAARRRAEADRIVATSSTSTIAGFAIERQVEAVFVDGFRRSQEAVEGLKAVAAMKGANAVINMRQERSADGRCGASGDAVIVRPVGGSTGKATRPGDSADPAHQRPRPD